MLRAAQSRAKWQIGLRAKRASQHARLAKAPGERRGVQQRRAQGAHLDSLPAHAAGRPSRGVTGAYAAGRLPVGPPRK